MRRIMTFASLLLGMGLFVAVAVGQPAHAAEAVDDSVGVVDTTQGIWWLRDAASGGTTSFYYGNPGDTPFAGDWDCDGTDTPGLYRRSDGYVYVRNSNTQGIADVSFFFGDPGDVPLAGDFNGDGCDTVSLFRPSTGRFYVINKLGSGDQGLGTAETEFAFGDAGDVPFVGDFDGDGIDTFGMRRSSSGRVYLTNAHVGGTAAESFVYGDPGDVVIAGAWAGGLDAVGIFRPSVDHFYLGGVSGVPGIDFRYGARNVVPVAGSWGALAGGGVPPVSTPALVSSFTTYHPCCQSRNTNINLIADMVDGAVVMPGEVFSLNDHVGQRTEAKGFVRAGAIIGGVIYCCDHPVNIGGGTSQFATTLYNAIFFGAYEDVYHRPHSLYFSRYPVGREATLGFPGPDVKFRNDTIFPVTIRTSHTSTSITVSMYGDNEDRSVSTATIGDVSPADGGIVTTYRTIVYANSTNRTSSWTHRYRAPIED